MRQILLRIALDRPWSGWEAIPGDVPHLGAAWIWLLLGGIFLAYHALTRQRAVLKSLETWGLLMGGLLVISFIHRFVPVPPSLPIFGYGMMVLIGFTVAMFFACARAKAVGINPELVVDSAFWVLISGVLGGRLAYLIQYRDQVFAPGMSFGQMLFKAVNLSEGGLVLLGALVGGGIGVFAYAWSRKISALEYGDLLIPSVFIGVGFGRIGCLLNGCCFGDRCELPWGIQFPAGSTTFNILVERGFLNPDALATMPLHPTQIYSSLDGFLLAFVTAIYYWYRKHPGDALALGCMLYSITRFLLEFLRADELGQLGTTLTISQFYSLGIFALGLVIMLTGARRGPARRPQFPNRLPDEKSEIPSANAKSGVRAVSGA